MLSLQIPNTEEAGRLPMGGGGFTAPALQGCTYLWPKAVGGGGASSATNRSLGPKQLVAEWKISTATNIRFLLVVMGVKEANSPDSPVWTSGRLLGALAQRRGGTSAPDPSGSVQDAPLCEPDASQEALHQLPLGGVWSPGGWVVTGTHGGPRGRGARGR